MAIVIGLLISNVGWASPCDDLRTALEFAEKVTSEIQQLQNQCDEYRTEKTRRLSKLNEVLSQNDLSSIQKTRASCYKREVEKIEERLLALGSEIKKLKIDAFSDVEQMLGPLLAKKASFGAASEDFKKGSMNYCDADLQEGFWSQVIELEQKYPEDEEISKICSSFRNHKKQASTDLSNLRMKFYERLTRSISKIDGLIASKKAVVRAAEGKSINKGIARAIEPLNATINAQKIYLDFSIKVKTKSTIARAQANQLIGAFDIARDDLEDLIERLKKFEASIATKLPEFIQNKISSDLRLAEGIKKRSLIQTLKEKDTRLWSYLKAFQAELAKGHDTCLKEHPTFESRYESFSKRFMELEEAFSKTADDKLAEARHRIGEQVVVDGHSLYSLCNGGAK